MLNCALCGFEYHVFSTVIGNARTSSYLDYISINAVASLSIFSFKQLVLKYKEAQGALHWISLAVKLSCYTPRKNPPLRAEDQFVWFCFFLCLLFTTRADSFFQPSFLPCFPSSHRGLINDLWNSGALIVLKHRDAFSETKWKVISCWNILLTGMLKHILKSHGRKQCSN